jgi:hypothetical protein
MNLSNRLIIIIFALRVQHNIEILATKKNRGSYYDDSKVFADDRFWFFKCNNSPRFWSTTYITSYCLWNENLPKGNPWMILAMSMAS